MADDLDFHAVLKTSDLDPGEAKQVMIGRKEIAIYNVEGQFYATDDICSHAYASLSDGYMEGDVIECPLHGGSFNIKTGKAVTAPCTEDIKTYPLKIEGDQILVGMPKA